MSHIARSLKQSNKKKRTEHSIIQITNKHITDHKSTPGEKKKKKRNMRRITNLVVSSYLTNVEVNTPQ